MTSKTTLGIILAAGIGSRLRPHTIDRPKALVEIGPNGETVLEHLAAACAGVGMDGLLVITGHEAAAVDRFIAGWDAPLPVDTLYNAQYSTMGNGQSLCVAREAVAGRTFFKFDGDLVLHAGILPRLAASPHRSSILLDDTKVLTDEDLKATIDTSSGLVTGLGKWLPNTSNGVSIGIERIDAADVDVVFDALERMIHVDGHSDRYYEDAYHTVLGGAFPLGHVTTGGLPWIEVDTADELAAGRALMRGFQQGAS